MRCFKCKSFTIFTFCRICSEILSKPTIATREIESLKIYSFYDYSDIKEILHSKHKLHGSIVFKALAKFSFKKFALNFKSSTKISAIPIDDKNKSGYSHTAILAKSMQTDTITPLFNALQATNDISYSGKDLKFRQSNPRKFKLLKSVKRPVILVDDIVTTGTTLLEARDILQKSGVDVLCAIVLADARF